MFSSAETGLVLLRQQAVSLHYLQLFRSLLLPVTLPDV